jgi:hypothetical protein
MARLAQDMLEFWAKERLVSQARSSKNAAMTFGGIPGVFQLNDEGIHDARFQL